MPSDNQPPAHSGVYSNVPVPDPSVITQQIIDKAEAKLRQDYVDKIIALRDNVNTRLDGIDKASIILAENVNRVPTLLDREVTRIVETIRRSEELMAEKFAAVGQQFRERDIRSDQDKSASSTAISAALSALKEMIALQNTANAAAITKSEASTIKQMDSILLLLASNNQALSDKVGVINGRLDRGEGGDKAKSSQLATAIAIGAVVVSLFVGVFSLVQRGQQETVVSPAVVPLAPR